MQNFMTTGLLISHINKINLHKKTLLNPTVYHEKYKKYRNVYNCVVKASKQMFLDSNFKKYKKNPKKTWDTLKDTIFGSHTKPGIDEIISNDKIINEPSAMATFYPSTTKTSQNFHWTTQDLFIFVIL